MRKKLKNVPQFSYQETIQKESFLFELFLVYFKPSNYIDSIDKISFEALKKQGKKLIICDLDNTLVPHFTKLPTAYSQNVIKLIKDNELEIIIISNNKEKRVEKFATTLDVPYISNAKKPFVKKIRAEIEKKNYKLEEIVFIGDMIIMDILAANILKVESILVKPIISYNKNNSQKFNWIEKNIFKRLERNNLLIQENLEKKNLYDKRYQIF